MDNTKAKITLIDDDENFLLILSLLLSENFHINTFHSHELALREFKTSPPDGVLLDLHMEGMKGFEVCLAIKTLHPDVPVFFLTNDVDPASVSKGLGIGATDYFQKSMPPEEIISRVNARLNANKKTNLRCREIEMDTLAFEIKICGKVVNFTPKEFNILKVFLELQNILLSKERLLALLWQDVRVESNNIDTHMFHMRKKFDGKAQGIECKKGLGYILRSQL